MKIFATIGLLCMVNMVFGQFDDCELKRNKDGIKVYTCRSANEKFKSLRAEFVLPQTTLDDLEKFLRDVENYPKWQYNMTKAEILKEVNATELILRSEIDAPWPVENREMVVQFTIDRDEQPNQMNVSVVSTPYDYPRQKDFIRVPFSEARWHVVAVGSDLRIEYFLRIDPGGSVPPWLVNIAMAEGPHETFKNLKKMIGTP